VTVAINPLFSLIGIVKATSTDKPHTQRLPDSKGNAAIQVQAAKVSGLLIHWHEAV